MAAWLRAATLAIFKELGGNPDGVDCRVVASNLIKSLPLSSPTVVQEAPPHLEPQQLPCPLIAYTTFLMEAARKRFWIN